MNPNPNPTTAFLLSPHEQSLGARVEKAKKAEKDGGLDPRHLVRTGWGARNRRTPSVWPATPLLEILLRIVSEGLRNHLRSNANLTLGGCTVYLRNVSQIEGGVGN
jgi:hypothetical protein